MRLFEWHSKAFPGDRAQTAAFFQYLSGVWQSRNRYVELPDEITEEEQQEQTIQKQRFFDFTIDGRISARNYVGVVQYEGIRIEVYPKLFAHSAVDDPSKWQLNILYWLSYCRKIRFPFSLANIANLKFDDFLEFLIYVFAHYTEEVISAQPFQAYQEVEEETAFLKGRLSFEKYIALNLTTGKWQNFQCRHEPFVYDNQFNRIIKFVARRLSLMSENYLNQEKLNEILFILHDVADLSCTATDCERVKLNPLYEDHKQVLELCKLFLSNQVIDMESEDSRNFCFLLPMEYIFEDFIFGFISHHWPSLKIKSQSTDYLAINKGQKVFQIKNDLYLENQLIIDTKYKIRSKDDGSKEGVSQGDLYQMVSYALRRNCHDLLLLYPRMQQARNEAALLEIPSEMLDEPLHIHIRSVDIVIDDLEGADEKMKGEIRVNLRDLSRSGNGPSICIDSSELNSIA